jgi:hypothetical protein
MTSTKPLRSGQFVMCQSSCKCRFCPKCAKALGVEIRRKLWIVLASFLNIQMWTLTVDPKLFTTELGAYRHVMKRRMMALLCSELHRRGYLHSRRYFWVLETHENGWVHFHLLLDASYVPFADVCEIWNRLGNGDPHKLFGRVQFSKGRGGKKGAFESAMHAAFYAMKYVVKEPENGWPEWLLNYDGNVKRFSPSQGFYASCDDQLKDPKIQIECNDGEIMEFETGSDQIDVTDGPENRKELKQRGPYKRTETIRLRIGACGNAGLIYYKRGRAWAFLGRLKNICKDIERYHGMSLAEMVVPGPGADRGWDLLLWSRLRVIDCPVGHVTPGGEGIIFPQTNEDGDPSVGFYSDWGAEELDPCWDEFDQVEVPF